MTKVEVYSHVEIACGILDKMRASHGCAISYRFYEAERYIKEYCLEEYFIFDEKGAYYRLRLMPNEEAINLLRLTMYQNDNNSFDIAGDFYPHYPNTNIVDDGIDYNAPHEMGLYLVAETGVNPYTNKICYAVKVGKSNSISERMRQYNTCAPFCWRVDYLVGHDAYVSEHNYHAKLHCISKGICPHNDEWFYVDRITYLKICEKGFKFFENI